MHISHQLVQNIITTLKDLSTLGKDIIFCKVLSLIYTPGNEAAARMANEVKKTSNPWISFWNRYLKIFIQLSGEKELKVTSHLE